MRKIKNPEKYIQRLKRYLKAAKSSKDFWQGEAKNRLERIRDLECRALGSYVTSYSKGCTKGISYEKQLLDHRFEVGRDIVITGRVTKIVRVDGDGNEAMFELEKIYVRE